MTVDEDLAAPGGQPAPERPEAPPPERDALARHVASMRRQRRWYVAVITLVVAAAVAVSLAVWFTGEITHVHMRTAATPAPSVPPGTTAAQPALEWQSDDATAIGAPFAGGTVVTYSRHTVSGRNALSGQVLWSYTRSDRSVCVATQQAGTTIAIYQKGGNCDEVTALDTGTGKRQWVRTLTDNGRPTYQVSPYTLLIVSPAAVHAVDPASGIDRWDYLQPDGCRTNSAVLGSAGTLISQHCADGDHLLLHDPNAGDDSKSPKPVRWRLNNNSTVPIAADTFLGAIDPTTHELVTFNSDNGKVARRVALDPTPAAAAPSQRASASGGELVWLAGTVYAFNESGDRLWSASLPTLPTISSADDSGLTTPDLFSARLLAADAAAVVSLDAVTGKISTRYPVTPPPAQDTLVFALGRGFLVAGSTTRVYQ